MRREALGRLGPQPVSLFDAEPVLLVDDDHAEAVEFDRVLQQRVRPDDDAGFALATSSRTCSLLLGRHGSGQQGDPRRTVRAAELARHRQRPENVADRAGMLGGKDFRRRQQRALIAGVDHLQHRQHGHDGLAGAHLALQHAVHRPAGRELAGDHVEHILLAVGQFERQLPAHRRDEAGVSNGATGPDSLSSPYRRPTNAHCSPMASS